MNQLIKTVARVVKDVEDLKTFNKKKETMLETKIDALKTSYQEQEKMIGDNTQKLKIMSTGGKWCGKKRVSNYLNLNLDWKWTSIDSNIELSGVSLNICTSNPLKI